MRPVCPAAEMLSGPPASGPSILCGVMRKRFDLIDSILGGAERGVLLTLRDDPSTVRGLCCGADLPVLGPNHAREQIAEFGRTHQNYTVCPIWIADVEMGWAEEKRHDLIEDGEYDPDEDPTLPSLTDLIYGRASIEEWAGQYAGDLPQDWTAEEEAEFAGAPVNDGALPYRPLTGISA